MWKAAQEVFSAILDIKGYWRKQPTLKIIIIRDS